MPKLTVTARTLPDGVPFRVTGRDAWTLLELHRAGAEGCTPIDNPAPRWAAYVFNLRTEHRLDVESVIEMHGGPFAGRHVRYVLRSEVEILGLSEDAGRAAKVAAMVAVTEGENGTAPPRA